MQPKKTAIIGNASVGFTTDEALAFSRAEAAGRSLSITKQGAISKGRFKEPTFFPSSGFAQPEFDTKEELDSFLEDTKHLPLKKVPKMPFNQIKDYIEEYSLIYQKKSKLTGSQRIHIKNTVHYYIRIGKITLK